jgi:hypothetical protein
MNHAALGQLPDHITHVRKGALIFHRLAKANWDSRDYRTIGAAKRYVRLDLQCKGGPRSAVRTAESLDLE